METQQGTITSLSTGRIVGSGQCVLRRSRLAGQSQNCHVLIDKQSFDATYLQDRFEIHLDDGREAEIFFARVEDDKFVFRCVDEL